MKVTNSKFNSFINNDTYKNKKYYSANKMKCITQRNEFPTKMTMNDTVLQIPLYVINNDNKFIYSSSQ